MKTWTRILATCALAIFAGCDKIDAPYFEDVNSGPVDTTQFLRKVLLEDYTGHTCGNCPKAAEEAEALVQIYGNKVVLMAIHAGFFAVPTPPAPLPSGAPAGSYASDFRTVAGDAYDSPQYFGISAIGNPNGMVNRVKTGNSYVVSYTNWGGRLASLLATAPDIGTTLTSSYNSGTRTAEISLNARILKSMSSSLNVVLCITENNIVTWQRDDRLANRNVPDYNHKHVLRANVNGTWGDPVFTASTAAGTEDARVFTYQLPSALNDDNCYAVAYIYDTATLEVVQADQVKIK